MIEYALRKNIRVAFENLRNVGNLAAIMERYERIPEIGFCYDWGHEHCYTQDVHFMDLFGRRIFCTHIHDNFGRSKEDPKKDMDIHVLPFDGNIDYKEIMSLMDKYNYTGNLTLEVEQGELYKDMTAEEFLASAYGRIKKISEM